MLPCCGERLGSATRLRTPPDPYPDPPCPCHPPAAPLLLPGRREWHGAARHPPVPGVRPPPSTSGPPPAARSRCHGTPPLPCLRHLPCVGLGPVPESQGHAAPGTEPGWGPGKVLDLALLMAQPGTAREAREARGSHLGAVGLVQPLSWDPRPRPSHRTRGQRRAAPVSSPPVPYEPSRLPGGHGGEGAPRAHPQNWPWLIPAKLSQPHTSSPAHPGTCCPSVRPGSCARSPPASRRRWGTPQNPCPRASGRAGGCRMSGHNFRAEGSWCPGAEPRQGNGPQTASSWPGSVGDVGRERR